MNHPIPATRGKSARSVKRPAKPRAATTRRPVASPNGEDRTEMIRRTAYSFYEARGRTDGHALDDWLQAQSQVEQSSGTGQSI